MMKLAKEFASQLNSDNDMHLDQYQMTEFAVLLKQIIDKCNKIKELRND